ncbi:MAG: 50S ribosome-binding GTPase [Rhodopseudomonas palustris]|nr:50S ribosome-binding GTPase [Rhodopseudomonas palustris]
MSGKSTLINRLANKNAAKVSDQPGVTRAPQWIKPDDNIWLLDTPGILPTNYEWKITALHLALLGSIKRDILPIETLAEHLFHYISGTYSRLFQTYLGQAIPATYSDLMDIIATKFGLMNQGVPDVKMAAWRLYQDFKDGVIGPMTLEVAY